MSDFLVAYFHTQLEAITSAKKLAAFGVQRERIAIHAPAKSTRGARRANAESLPGDRQARQDIVDLSDDPTAEEFPETPLLSASTTLTVVLKGSVSINDVCSALKDAGAYLIDVTEQHAAQQYPDM